MYQCGPYGPNHATAATFAFKKELLKQTRFDETACLAEEKKFLKDYTIPFVQLDPKKSILVFSHNQNSFDKKELLMQPPTPTFNPSPLKPSDLVKEEEVLKFFMKDIDEILSNYEPGSIKNKPDVTKQLVELKAKREQMIKEMNDKKSQYNSTMQNMQYLNNPQLAMGKINEQSMHIQHLTNENTELKNKVKYLEDKLKQIISEKIQIKKNEKLNEAKEQTKPVVQVVEDQVKPVQE